MNLEFDEAIENHRKMWNWIADETEQRKEIVTKEDYFAENKIQDDVFENCYACEYGIQQVGTEVGVKNARIVLYIGELCADIAKILILHMKIGRIVNTG